MKNDSVAEIEVFYTYYEKEKEMKAQRMFEHPYNSSKTNGDMSEESIIKMIKSFWVRNRTPHLQFGAIEWTKRHK